MKMFFKAVRILLVLILALSLVNPPKQASAKENSYQKFKSALSNELNQYIRKSGGLITLKYRDLTNGDEYQINAGRSRAAASTIKLPLALYVMELASQGKINLNQKLTYKSYHFYGGSGIIQKDKVGSRYTIRDLVKKSMVYSDNIAFIMLKEKVGRSNFNAYLKRVGGRYAYPSGQNNTSAEDLTLYAVRLYQFSQNHALGKELVGYLKNTIYNTTIPKKITDDKVAHKVGFIPSSRIFNDVGIVYNNSPYILAVMTSGISYEKSQRVIADITAIFHKHHKKKHLAKYIKALPNAAVYQHTSAKSVKLGTITKGETYKTIFDKGFWYEVQFGTKKGYVKKKEALAYSEASSNGFSNGKVKNTYLLKSHKTAYIRTSSSIEGEKIATLYKNNEINFDSMNGNWYKVTVADRVGYIHKSSVDVQFSPAIKFVTINKDEQVIYSKGSNKSTKIGILKKGETYPRIKEDGTWSVIQFGSQTGYIQKAGTSPIYKVKLDDLAGNKSEEGTIHITEDTQVLSGLTDNSSVIGSIYKGSKVAYLDKSDDGYMVNFSGRKGYIRTEHALEVEETQTVNPAFAKTSAKPIRITFAGDLMMDWSVKETINKKGADYPFQQVKADVVKSDLAIANLETAITTRTTKWTKEYNFKSNPSSLKGVKNAGFDLVSLANNHSMDYTRAGLVDTLKNLKKYELSYIGAGYNSKEAYSAKSYTVNGKKIKFLAFSKVLPSTSWIATTKLAGLANGYNLSLMLSTIKRESKNTDYVFVYIHWGIEKSKRPEAYQRTWAKKMIDSGADAVVGSHPHVLQGFEYYKGKPIAYSLGNFLFPNYVRGDKAQTGLLHFTLEKGKIGMAFTPYYISNDLIKSQSTTTRKKVWKNLESLSYGVKITDGVIKKR